MKELLSILGDIFWPVAEFIAMHGTKIILVIAVIMLYNMIQ